MIDPHRHPTRRIGVLAVATALLLAACGGSAPSPSPQPASADPATAVRPSPAPTATQSAAERFWSELGLEASGPRYGSLAEIGAASDAVVVGRVTGVRFAYEQRDLGAEAAGQPRAGASVYYGEITLAVEDVLAGTLLEPGVVRLIVIVGSPDMVGDVRELLPPSPERVVLFLVDPLRLFGDRLDLDPGLREAVRGKHIPTNVDQSVIIEVGGRVAPPPHGPTPFLVALAGRPFDEVVEAVRAAVR